MSKARKAYYSMCSAGLPYPGLPVDIKAHLFKSVCLPTLFYGLETVYLADNMLKNIDNMQGSLIKKCLGVGKFSHHSILLRAFGLEKADSLLSRAFRDLWRRVFACDSPMRTLCSLLLARWLTGGDLTPGTLLSRVASQDGQSPVTLAFTKRTDMHATRNDQTYNDGIYDSIRYLMYSEDFLQKNSLSHKILCL